MSTPTKIVAFFAWLAWAAATNAAQPVPAPGLCVKCKALRAIDGDTIEVEITTKVRVRLLDCWAPESRSTDKEEKAKGLAAKESMEVAIAGQPDVTLFIPSGDARSLLDVTSMGRALGYVWVEDFHESLSEMQVRIGNASTRKGGKLGE